jgi:hypothetical protein
VFAHCNTKPTSLHAYNLIATSLDVYCIDHLKKHNRDTQIIYTNVVSFVITKVKTSKHAILFDAVLVLIQTYSSEVNFNNGINCISSGLL